MIVIGCGRDFRGDDAAGLEVARRLRALGFPAFEHAADGAALLDLWDGCDEALLIDAAVTGAEPGAILCWDGVQARARLEGFRSAHAFGVAEAIELGCVLGRLPRILTLYGIESREFNPGSGVSPAVSAAIELLVRRIASALRAALAGAASNDDQDCA